MPAGPGEDAERFAAAVELGQSPESRFDDELAQDLEIVAMLRSRGPALDPSPATRSRAKQQLMARLAAMDAGHGGGGAQVLTPAFPTSAAAPTELLPAVVEHQTAEPAETDPGLDATGRLELTGLDTGSDPAPGTAAPTPLRRPGRARHSRRSGRPEAPNARRFPLIGAAATVLALALAGGGVLVSRDALPGDGLYQVKRVAEAAGLAMTFDEASKARRHLDLASTRLGEVEQLVAAEKQAGRTDPELVNSTIREFDDSTGEGARILLASTDPGTAGARDELRSWAAEQSARLTDLQPELPAGTDTADTLRLLDRVVGRTEALRGPASCTTPPNSVDDLGPVPSCDPAAGGGIGPDPAPTSAGQAGEPTRTGPSAGPTGRGGAGPSTTNGSPSNSRRAPADDEGLLDPVEDTLDGVLGGGGSSSDRSTTPNSSDEDDRDDEGGSGGGLPIDVPPLLPGLGL